MEEKKLIEFREIVKNFDGQIVLKGVNLDIYGNQPETAIRTRIEYGVPEVRIVPAFECV